jgi:hypothetical protein
MSSLQDHGTFISYSAADWRDAIGEMPPFLLAGCIASGVTQVYGMSESGKSMLVSAAVAALVSGKSFLGCGAAPDTYKAAILVGDTGDGRRYSRRLERILDTEELQRITIYDPTAKGMPFDGWDGLLPECRRESRKILVVDSLSTFVDGDLNSGPACKDFYDRLTYFTAKDINVIVVAHSTEKFSRDGAAQDFIGHSTIKQRPNWHCRVRKSADRKTLWFHGNDESGHEIVIRQPDGGAPAFDVISTADGTELHERSQKRQRQRADTTKAKRGDIGDWVYQNCQGRTRNESAAKAHAEFPNVAVETIKSNLSRGAYKIRQGADRHSWIRDAEC